MGDRLTQLQDAVDEVSFELILAVRKQAAYPFARSWRSGSPRVYTSSTRITTWSSFTPWTPV